MVGRPPMSGRFDLAAVAPRLARAHRAQRAHLALELKRRRHARNTVMALEALVAHRDLQLLRAMAKGDARYIARRHHKLAQSQEQLRRARAKAHRLGA